MEKSDKKKVMSVEETKKLNAEIMAKQSANAKALVIKTKAKGRSERRIRALKQVIASDSISTDYANRMRLKAAVRKNKQ